MRKRNGGIGLFVPSLFAAAFLLSPWGGFLQFDLMALAADTNLGSHLNASNYGIYNLSGLGIGTDSITPGAICFASGCQTAPYAGTSQQTNAAYVTQGTFGSSVSGSNNQYYIKPTTDTTAAFGVQNSGGTSVLDVDTSNQRVGIRTSTPGYTLDVNGTAHVNGLIQMGVGGISNNYSIPNSCGGTWQVYVESAVWAPDYSGGCGDEWYIAEIQNGGTGEQSSLVINQSNDQNDTLVLSASGGVYVGGSPSPYNSVAFTVNGASTFNNQVTINGNLNMGTNSISMSTTNSTITVNKLDVNVIDPIYSIGGANYATYGPDVIGLKTEVFGKATLANVKSQMPNAKSSSNAKCQNGSDICNLDFGIKGADYQYVIDFSQVPIGSDLWLFWQTINEGKDMADIAVYLTPEFNGRVWYEIEPTVRQIILFGEPSVPNTEHYAQNAQYFISYHFVAPRFDADKWSNTADAQKAGMTPPLK